MYSDVGCFSKKEYILLCVKSKSRNASKHFPATAVQETYISQYLLPLNIKIKKLLFCGNEYANKLTL